MMYWFEGTIASAIQTAKAKQAIFVVYVYDGTEASTSISDVLQEEEIIPLLNNESFVSVRIENGKDDARNFSLIYPLVVVPSLFFISGETGVLMEVLGTGITVTILKEKLNKLAHQTKETSDSQVQKTEDVGGSKVDVTTNKGGSSNTTSDPAPLVPTTSDPGPLAPTTSDPAPLAPTPSDPAPLVPTTSDPAPLAPTPSDPALLVPSTSADTSQRSSTDLTSHTKSEMPPSALSTPSQDIVDPIQQSEASVNQSTAQLSESAKSHSTPEEKNCQNTENDVKNNTDVCQETGGATGQDGEQLVAGAMSNVTTNNDAEDPNHLMGKIDRVKQLLEEKKENDLMENQQETRKKENDRRRTGQEISKNRQRQEEKEIISAAEDRRKEKELDRLAREKVKAQIQSDRAEREARAAALRGDPSPSMQCNEPVAIPNQGPRPAVQSDISRLKFRLPDGSSHLAQFSSQALLSEVHQHVEENITLTFRRFTLMSTLHHRAFIQEDMNTSLIDLGLVPSAIIVICPAPSGGGKSGANGGLVPSSGDGGGVINLLWLLLTPVTLLLNYVRRYLFSDDPRSATPAPQRPEPSDSPASKRQKSQGSYTTRHRPQTAYGPRSGSNSRREGNIHRFNNPNDNEDDDDDNTTWNGNSTQQM